MFLETLMLCSLRVKMLTKIVGPGAYASYATDPRYEQRCKTRGANVRQQSVTFGQLSVSPFLIPLGIEDRLN